MSWKWKSVTEKLYDISFSRSGKAQLENSTTFYFNEVEKFNWRSLRYFMSTKWKSLIDNSTIFLVMEVEKYNWTIMQYFMSTKWKSLTGDVYDISCP